MFLIVSYIGLQYFYKMRRTVTWNIHYWSRFKIRPSGQMSSFYNFQVLRDKMSQESLRGQSKKDLTDWNKRKFDHISCTFTISTALRCTKNSFNYI